MKNLLCIVVLTVCLNGCGSIANLIMGPRAFGGIEWTIDEIKGSGSHLWWLDLPFSIVVDVVTLPVAVIAELTGWAR